MKSSLKAVTLLLLAASFEAAPALGQDLHHNRCEAEIIRAADQYGIPVPVLYAVGLSESGRKGQLSPLAMNLAGRPYFAKSVSEAMQVVMQERARGVSLIDVGCMQINIKYHSAKFRSIEQMFDPRSNVQYAARFLSELRKSMGSWTMAVARYHAGPNNNPAQRKYICLVIRNMVSAGAGEWTANARAFCA
jgi:soluble lytic murein transglycosylase-like protein